MGVGADVVLQVGGDECGDLVDAEKDEDEVEEDEEPAPRLHSSVGSNHNAHLWEVRGCNLVVGSNGGAPEGHGEEEVPGLEEEAGKGPGFG